MKPDPGPADYKALMAEALVELEVMDAKLRAMEREKSDPIAVVGMGCRFPCANDPESFWALLLRGGDAVGEVPWERWDLQEYYDANPDAPGKTYSRHAGLLEGLQGFDAEFFNITPREAESVDPQQRLLLEVSWEALERAGIPPDSLQGTQTGVFVGIASQDYSRQLLARGIKKIDAYMATGTAHSVAAGRVSYTLGLKGPCVAIDTACSSSLVAVHLACQSLRIGECELALAGGVNCLISPDGTINLSKLRMLSPTGRCRTFDDGADGFVRAEGCGILVLRRLSEAVARREPVLAVIRGSAVSHDGRTSGLTVPSGPSQQEVIHQALQRADVKPEDVTFLEAHGTGTSLGDPIEVGALDAVFGPGRAPDRPLIIGSVKTNIGHAEAAAGIAGMIKVILSLEHDTIPPHLHFQRPSRHIPWERLPMVVPTEPTSWSRQPTGRRIAGISSFGFGGTNAHVVVEGSDSVAVQRDAPSGRAVDQPRPSLLPLSARSREAARQLAERYAQHPGSALDQPFEDVCFTAGAGRSHFPYRVAVVGESVADLREKLSAWISGAPCDSVFEGFAPRAPKVGFLFTGQGSQYVGMGRELYERQPTFRRVLERCDGVFRSATGESLIGVMYERADGAEWIGRTAYAQPALFAVEMGLAELWRSWGIEPGVVMGHSVGEYAAACVSGVFGIEDAMRLVCARGRLMQGMAAGTMVAVFAERAEVEEVVRSRGSEVAIAAVNGPRHVVISGVREATDGVVGELGRRGVRFQPLKVSHAFHSPMMTPMLEDYLAVAREVTYGPPAVDLISNVTGEAAKEEVTRAEYWVEHVQRPVQFERGMRTMQAASTDVFLEVGPKPTLLALGRECLEKDDGLWLESLRPGVSEQRQMLSALGRIYARGAAIDWRSFESHRERHHVALPTYPFQRVRHWPDMTPSAGSVSSPQAHGLHPLLGTPIRSAVREFQFECDISKESPGFLAEHRVLGTTLVPAGVFVEMALAAAEVILRSDRVVVKNLSFETPLSLDEPGGHTLQVIVGQESAGAHGFQIYSLSSDDIDGTSDWVRHASGSILRDESEVEETQPRLPLPAHGEGKIDVSDFARILTRAGMDVNPEAVRELWRHAETTVARLALPEPLHFDAARYFLHPVLLNACFLALLPMLADRHQEDEAWIPVGIRRIRLVKRALTELWCEATPGFSPGDRSSSSPDNVEVDFRLFSPQGDLVARLEGVELRRVSKTLLVGRDYETTEPGLYKWEWQAAEADGGESPAAEFVRSPERIAEDLRSRVSEVAARPEVSQVMAAYEVLNDISVDYILEACADMDIDLKPGARVSARQAADRTGTSPKHLRLWSRVLEILSGAGVLKEAGDGWEVVAAPERLDRRQPLEEYVGRFPAARAERTLLDRCGPRLADVLADTCDPLELIFPGGDLTLASQFYETSPAAQAMNTLVREAIANGVSPLPPNRPLRILEIGAGTGGTTAAVLPCLTGTTEYLFTDVSPLFLARAQEKFKDYPFVRYELFDVEREPGTQGFDRKRFDIILAAHVLHATADLRRTLSHVRSLMSPGGLLVLLEGTRAIPWVDLVFGLTEGWWKFADEDLRPSYPLLSSSAWSDLLLKSGFRSVSPVGLVHEGSTFDTAPSVFLAQNDGAPSPVEVTTPKSWLILADAGGIGHGVAQRLAAAGDSCTIVRRSSEYAREGDRSFFVNPEHLAHFEQLVEDASRPITGVIHLWSLDVADSEDLTRDRLEASFALGPGSVLHLTRALGQMEATSRPKVWFCTRGAVAVERNSTTPGLAQSLVWGMGKAVALEHPELWGGLIDLSASDTGDETIETLTRALSEPSQEEFLAFRGRRRYQARIVREASSLPSPRTFRPDGTYVITGGLGTLGLKLASFLFEHEARHLVLVGRRSPSLPARARMAKLRSAGCNLQVVQADVSDAGALRELLRQIGESRYPLRGVIHAAGAGSFTRLEDMTLQALSEELRGKVIGGWLLHELTADLELDFCVFYSSMVSLWGAMGQGAYAAANQFLDTLAHHRRGCGLPALSVNWGLWETSDRAGLIQQLAPMGVRTLRPRVALETLGSLLATDVDQVAVADIDWRVFKRLYETRRRRPLFDRIDIEPDRASTVKPSSFRAQLERAPLSERYRLLRTRISAELSAVVGSIASQGLDDHQGFADLGMDSLMAVEFKNRLEKLLACRLPSTVAFDHPTVNDLTRHLFTDILGWDLQQVAARVSQESEQKEAAVEVSRLSPDQVEESIANELEQLEAMLRPPRGSE